MPQQAAEVHKWTEQYAVQEASSVGPSDAGGLPSQPAAPFLLPIMPLKKVKCPTETVQLQIFEPRYRLMFRLVNQSRSRRFGVALTDPTSGEIQRVGTLCELTHFIPVPERRRVFISARAVGRYYIPGEQLKSDKPFLVAECSAYDDYVPPTASERAQLARLEADVWAAMVDVRDLASKLFSAGSGREGLGDEAFSLEVRRWAPDAVVRAGVEVAAGSDPALMEAVKVAGLLGEGPEDYTQREGAAAYICTDAVRQHSEEHRASNFSFCLLRASDTPPEVRLAALRGRSTAERLRMAEAQIMEGRSYLAARSTLKDMFS